MIDLKKIFEKRISKVPKVRSINGLFIAKDDSLEATNYQPAYQRNYVWDDEKATYFIESIFLGTEVPPLILFKSENEDGFINYEVIDGRQRYQTILRFINNELKLKKNGLQRLYNLQDFVGKSFCELESKYQNLFKETKIRIIEYSFITEYNQEEEDIVKREIFQRYNSGITPLKSYEIDKAQYYYNDINLSLKGLLKENIDFNDTATTIFKWEKLNIDQKVSKLRELLVLHRIPIKYYASKKRSVIDKYFEYLSTQIEEEELENIISKTIEKVKVISNIEKKIRERGNTYNRLYSECLFWIFSVLEQNDISPNIDNELLNRLIGYFDTHKEDFTMTKSSFYNVLVKRYVSIATFFENEFHCNLDSSINNNEDFKRTNKLMPTNISNLDDKIEYKSFEELRINKPEPTSVELTELLDNLRGNRFILRPAYQRADVKNKKKSSSIIESMLLGIMLPPIFVFKRLNGITEVVDGQQRLLSIISFIGESYVDENGNNQKPLLSNFKLDLDKNAILKELKGYQYKDLSKADQNKIRKTSLYIIEIKEEKNEGFDPVDLFVRLNNKPYPIASDSFEMWNSFASRNQINLIKEACKNNEKWFYFRKDNSRMYNENLYTTLAYFQYMFLKNGMNENEVVPDKTIKIFVVDNRLAFRFSSRNDITKLMYEEKNADFIRAINYIEFNFVANLRSILSLDNSQLSLNKELDSLLKVENGRRTQMSFYILWILLHDLPTRLINPNKDEVKKHVIRILHLTETCSNKELFKNIVKQFRNNYLRKYYSVNAAISDITTIDARNINEDSRAIKLFNKPLIGEERFIAKMVIEDSTKDGFILLNSTRYGIYPKYLEAYLRSQLFYYVYTKNHSRLLAAINDKESLPYISIEKQEIIIKVLNFIDRSENTEKKYFQRLLDLLFYECNYPDEFIHSYIDFFSTLKKYDIMRDQIEEKNCDYIKKVYDTLTKDPNIETNLLKVIDLDIVNTIEYSLRK